MLNRILARLRTPDGNINPWVIAITVTLATFMEVLDASIANVALPHISGNLWAGAEPWRTRAVSHLARRGWRRFAAQRAGHFERYVFTGEARHGFRGLRN